MFTEVEWGEAKELAEQYREDEIIIEAREITSTIYGSLVSEGPLAARRHAVTVGFEIGNSDLQKVLDDLHELFVFVR